jgi:plastocyanin
LTLRRIVLASVCAFLVLAVPAQAKERTYTFRAGPYTMGGFNTQFIKDPVDSPKVRGYVTEMHAKLVNAHGTPVTIHDGMLHHVFFNNLSVLRIKGHCTARQPEVFYSTGEENETLDLPKGYGYAVKPSDRWRVSAMLMSHRAKVENVYIRYRVTVSTKKLTGVRPLWVRANGCGPASSYGVRGGGAPGSVDDRVEHWKVPLSGRIVAAGGHLHAGSIGLQVREPACGNRLLWDNTPHFAPADAAVYTAKPMLHEAGPINTSWFSSATGIPVKKGQTLDVHGLYDGVHARGAVMAITHIYVAPDKTVKGGCPALPADMHTTPAPPGTREASQVPYQPIPLWRINKAGKLVQVDQPTDKPLAAVSGTSIAVRTAGFKYDNVQIKVGDELKWRFTDDVLHNLTFASGPRAVLGQNGKRGDVITTRFDTPGRYQLFCYLHPMTMREQVTVLPRS